VSAGGEGTSLVASALISYLYYNAQRQSVYTLINTCTYLLAKINSDVNVLSVVISQ
jgi:hypothetical protein